ncbi:hypothetical protein [Novosphingobium olei]|uniref:Uncharacterized protein n=1 Tax=Novosphingobium olei TaxID=2728851 RepID=A0A7Y0BMI6_9SPHN|nr:hypothetical protein [Novosphingobium olei]NML93122.1 hypothetical protein [Novosphingobium olei]
MNAIASTHAPAGSAALNAQQSGVMIVAGIVLWYAAAVLLRALSDAQLLGGSTGALVFAATVPGTLPFVLLLRRLGGLGADQVVPGYTLATTAALLCDGVAMTWYPALYGADDTAARLAAGGVIFGGAVGLALAFFVAAQMRRN